MAEAASLMHKAGRSDHPAYRPDIDGLRAVAVLAVLLHHGFPAGCRSGYIGVDIFFVISGFLISAILFRSLDLERFSIADFYRRRVNRIFPALILVITATYVFGWNLLFSGEMAQLGKHLLSGAGFVSNLVLWSEAGYFQAASQSKPLLHLWSLGIEEQFYIVWPLLLWATHRRHLGFLGITALILVASLGLNIYDVAIKSYTAAFYSPLTRIWELMAGGLLAYAQQHPETPWANWSRRWSNLQAGLGALLLLSGFLYLTEKQPYPGVRALIPVVGACLLIGAGANAGFNRLFLGHRVLVAIGLISYPLYLWHWPLLAYARIIDGGDPGWQIRSVALAISFPLAFATYWLLERPLRRHPASARKRCWVLAVIMVLIAIVGLVTLKTHGLPHRAANAHEPVFGEVPPEGVDAHRLKNQCSKQLGMLNAQAALCYMKNDAPEILLLGDSHSVSLRASLEKNWVPMNAMVLSSNGCLPFRHYLTRVNREIPGAFDCGLFPEQIDLTLAHQPGLKTVVLVTRGPIYFSGHDFDRPLGSDLPIHNADDRRELQGSEAEAAFVAGYVDLVRQLAAAGKQVVFMLEWPELNFDPALCVARTLTPWRETRACSVPRAEVDARRLVYTTLVARIQAQVPFMKVYDPLPLFCNASVCDARINDRLYYLDDDHLSSTGSRAVMLDLQAWLEQQ